MKPNHIIWIFMFIGGTLGGYIPLIWGSNYFSLVSITFNALGALLGIWIAFKITN